MAESENIVWVNDEDDMFTKAKLLPTAGRHVTTRDIFNDKVVDGLVNVFILRSASVIQFTLDKVHEYDESHESKSADVSVVTNLHPASLLHIIKSRFQSSLPYTRVFSGVISVNLYESSADILNDIQAYESLPDLEKRGHIFSVARAAVDRVNIYNQSIILLGESGAGKTHVFTNLIPYICSGSVREKASAAAQVLAAFGNCQTRLNSDSSRYTRYMRVRYKVIMPLSL